MAEVQEALFIMNTHKTPGPDGVQALFFKFGRAGWWCVTPCLILLIICSQILRTLPYSIKRLFVSLIPKKTSVKKHT